MTKTDLLSGLSEIRVASPTRTSARATLQAKADKLTGLLTQIALDPEATAHLVNVVAAHPRTRDAQFLARCFTIVQEELVAAGELDAVTRF